MYYLENSHLNLNYLNDKINISFIVESNIKYDIEHSDKSLSSKVNHTCDPHLIGKINCLKSEINEKKEGIIDDKNTLVSDKEKSSKKIEAESLDAKTIFIGKKISVEEKEKEKIMIIIMMSMINLLMVI